MRLRRRAAGAEREIERALARVSRAKRPVVVGPWQSELGFEVVYWIPFLRWLVARYELDPSALVAVSRGGVASWYEGICSRYADIWDLVGVDEHRRAAAERRERLGGQKQESFTRWDEWVLAAGQAELSWRRGDPIIHPGLMYGLLRRYWKGGAPIRLVLDHAVYRRWQPPPAADVPFPLPDDYVAVKFYFSDSFPETGANRAFADAVVAALARRTHVVLLSTSLQADGHSDYEPAAGGRVVRGLANVGATRNLAAQSAVVARARAVVGTYGGYAYIPAGYGVASLAFASRPEQFMPSHLDVARRAASALGAPFTVLDTASAETLSLLGPLHR